MTAADLAVRPAAPPSPSGPQPFAGTGALLRFGLRRDRRRLVIWVVALGVLPVYTTVALRSLYGGTRRRSPSGCPPALSSLPTP